MMVVDYKCGTCESYDLCETCEGREEHPHACLKIREPMNVVKNVA